MAIAKEFIIQLKGRDYPLWAGVLDAATRAGLKSLRTTIVQIPTSENKGLAIVTARAEFEDGRVFEDVGDCSPQSTSPHLVAASIRLASTRAKGRCLRDAINVGQTMFEELPDLDQVPEVIHERISNARHPGPPVAAGEGTQTRCVGCGCDMSPGQVRSSIERYGQPLCSDCQRHNDPFQEQAEKPIPAQTLLECSNPTCKKTLTKGQYDVSQRAYGQPLCPACQKTASRLA